MSGVDVAERAAPEQRASAEAASEVIHGSGAGRPFTLGVLSLFAGGFYFGDVLSGIAATAARRGAQVLAVQTADPWAQDGDQPAPYLPLACDHVDGLLVIADALRDDDRPHLAALGKPIVTISAHNPLPGWTSRHSGAEKQPVHASGVGHPAVS